MKKENKKILRYLMIIVGVIIILEILIISSIPKIPKQKQEVKEEIEVNTTKISMKLPAINNEGEGVATILKIEAKKGDGRTLTDIENILFFADTQQSIRMARLVAEDITEINCDNYELIYSIKANASIIGGPSAGAALTIGTIKALEGRKVNQSVMITGTINHDGSIGPVSEILEKAEASKKAGATLFLVPLGQSRGVIYETREHCEKFGFTEVCTTETIPKRVDVGKEVGIKIREVENIEEALDYF
jgi:uncharacterized protein